MIETQSTEPDRRDDFLIAVALCLIVGVVLLIVAAIVSSGRFSGAPGALPARDRVEVISEQAASVVTAAFVLAAVVALSFLRVGRLVRVRPLVIVAFLVGAAIALLAVYSIVDIITIHIPSESSANIVTADLIQGSIGDRLGIVLPAVAALFIALVAVVGANRLGHPSPRPDDTVQP